MAEVFSFSLFPFSFLGFLIDIEMEIEGAKFGGCWMKKKKDGMCLLLQFAGSE